MKPVDRYANRRGVNNALAKLNDEIVREIRAARAGLRRYSKRADESRSLKALAERFNLSLSTISHVANGRSWKHIV